MGPIYNRIHLGLGIPRNCYHKMIPSQIHFFRDAFLTPKRSRAKMLTLGPKIQSRAQKSAPGHEKTKDAGWTTMQNPVLGIPNGAICCKLWPKTILKGHSQIWAYATRREILFSRRETLLSIREVLSSIWEHRFQERNPAFKKGSPRFEKGNPQFKTEHPV